MPAPAWRLRNPWDPRNPQNRDRIRRLKRELRVRLLEWDPLGVGDNPHAQDEYDCLISPLMHRLSDGRSERDIADWLIEELTNHFGMSADARRERDLAGAPKSWSSEATTAQDDDR